MQTELYSMSKVFTEAIFRIPDYQRGYSWGERQLRDFWSDLSQLEQGSNHYTGVLTLEEVSPEVYRNWEEDLWIIESRGYRPYYVVDGQQRLTTVLIAIQGVLERFQSQDLLNYTPVSDIRRKFICDSKDRGVSHSFMFGYEKDNPSYEYLKTYTFGEQSDKHSSAEDTIYTHNLSFAKEFFAKHFEVLSEQDLELIYRKLTQGLLFNIYTIAGEIDVCVTFETMNNRGKPLSHLELLKNRLIYLSTRFRGDEDERETLRRTINESWKSVYHYLGKNKDRPLNDDEFLLTHFLLRYGNTILTRSDSDGVHYMPRFISREDYYADHLLNNIFAAKRIICPTDQPYGELSVSEVYEYARDIKKVVQTFFRVLNPALTSLSSDEKIWLERLNRLEPGYTVALVVAVYLLEKDVKARVNLLLKLENVLFIRSIIPWSPDAERLDLQVVAVKLMGGDLSVHKVTADLAEFREKALKRTDCWQALSDIGRNRGYYGWRAARYFFFEYEQELMRKSRTHRSKLSWDDFCKEDFGHDYYTLEHIYPQKVSQQCWKEPFRVYSVKQRNILKNSLGNLLPLSRSKNSSLKNQCFSEKKAGTKEENTSLGFTYGCYSEIEVAREDQWTALEILDRGVRLLEFMERRWDVPLGDRAAKVRALRLEFVERKMDREGKAVGSGEHSETHGS